MSYLEPVVVGLNNLKEGKLAREVLAVLGKHSCVYQQYDELALCYFRLKEYDTAIMYGEKTLITARTAEQMYVSRTNLINLYNHGNYPEKALDLIKILDITHPNDVHNQLEKAFSFYLSNRKEEAEAIIRHQLETNKTLDEETQIKLKFNLGTYELYRDEFQQGLRHFLYEGQKLKFWHKPSLPRKKWDGTIIPGLTLILIAEAGIGDEIINVRFMKHLRERGMNPIWYTDRADIRELFNNNGFTAIGRDDLKTIHDYQWICSMELPVWLNLQYEDLWHGPYLKPFKDVSLPEQTNKLKIGVRWQGNAEHDFDLHRSIPLKEMYEAIVAAGIPVQLYSLQRDVGAEDVKQFPDIIDMVPLMETFGDTFSLINQLDLVVSSCTSVVHAAASMGKPVIIMTPISAYYTWSHSAKQSPWYGDNVTLFRQQRPRVWDEPLAELTQHLIDHYKNG